VNRQKPFSGSPFQITPVHSERAKEIVLALPDFIIKPGGAGSAVITFCEEFAGPNMFRDTPPAVSKKSPGNPGAGVARAG
jgi:hypothetical protein